ncbi:type IV pilin biogenesis protein [Caulifigura coniformis]|uniref:Type IV pilin biogenesis protein n=1 Tax=Caulifigura coniformis TaxID=2527983 RepID=A0A517SJF8_9PLAN|nr:type II secretion system F family protein [Caulifigura coniformis]QDT56260.1 type IV pilin biogenesis protein [Caulifigura coniformis]
MLPMLILLGMPILAGALLALDHYVRFNASRDELSWLALAMRIVGLALAGAGLTVLVLAALGRHGQASHWFFDAIVRIAAGAYGLLAILTAVVGNAFRAPRDSTNLREESRLEQRASLFRLLCWIALLVPLVPFVPAVVLIVPLVLTTVFSSWGAVNRGSQISLLWRLSIASENGLPYADEVESASPGIGSHRRESLAALAGRLRDGQSLGEAIDDGSPLIPRGDVLAIRATDGTPALSSVLRDAAERSVRNLSELREGGDALPLQVYFVNVFLVVISIVSFLMYWIMPKYKEIFNDFGVTLPPITRRLIDVTDSAASYWFVAGPMMFLPVAILLASPLVSLAGWENLNFPLLMRWFPRRDAPEVLRIIAAVVESGRPLAPTLSEIAEHHPREDLRSRLERIAAILDHGEFSWRVLCHDGFLKQDEADALDAAAANHHLQWALRTLADGLDAKQRIRTAWAFEWQRPILIGTLGGLVAFVVVAMFLPLIHVMNTAAEMGP